MSGTPSKQESGRARVGSVLKDKWRLDALLGVGGTAAVYAGSHRNGKRAAIKVLHRELSTNDDLVGRFLREGYVANKLEHPGAVSVLDDDRTEDGSVFLVMELLDGYSLERHTRMNAERLTVRQVIAIGDEVLDVLANAHVRGVIHRDIKPANLFLCSSGKVKVLDFGIARLREGNEDDVSTTQTGTSIGTPAFMPPEQARGRWKSVDPRTDIWSVGATLFALLTGQRPRRAETVNEELLLAMTAPVAKIQSVARDVPTPVARVVDRALEFEMDARFPDARTMQLALRAAASDLGFAGPASVYASTIGQFNTVEADTAPVVHGFDPRSQPVRSMGAQPHGGQSQLAQSMVAQSQLAQSMVAQSQLAQGATVPHFSAMTSTSGVAAPSASFRADASTQAMTSPMPLGSGDNNASTEFLDPRLTTSRPILAPSFPPAPRPQSGLTAAVIAMAVLGVVVCAGGVAFYKVRASGARAVMEATRAQDARGTPPAADAPTSASPDVPQKSEPASTAPNAAKTPSADPAITGTSPGSSASAATGAKKPASAGTTTRSPSSGGTTTNGTTTNGTTTNGTTTNGTSATKPSASSGNPWDTRF